MRKERLRLRQRSCSHSSLPNSYWRPISQPGGELASLLAQSLAHLQANGLTLSGYPGKRTVFAVSGALRATVAPDRSTITLANSNELLGHWIIALRP